MCPRGAQESNPASTDTERGAKVERNMRKDCGEAERTKCEWWDAECLNQWDRCVVSEDCGHPKRAMRSGGGQHVFS